MLTASKTVSALPNDTVIAAVVDGLLVGMAEFVEANSWRYSMNDFARLVPDIELLHCREPSRGPFGNDQGVTGLIGVVAVTTIRIERQGCDAGWYWMVLYSFAGPPGTSRRCPGRPPHKRDALAIAELAATEQLRRIGCDIGRRCNASARRRPCGASSVRLGCGAAAEPSMLLPPLVLPRLAIRHFVAPGYILAEQRYRVSVNPALTAEEDSCDARRNTVS